MKWNTKILLGKINDPNVTEAILHITTHFFQIIKIVITKIHTPDSNRIEISACLVYLFYCQKIEALFLTIGKL